jgi:hypothetical protein
MDSDKTVRNDSLVQAGCETRDVSGRGAAFFATGLVGALVVIFISAYWLLEIFTGRSTPENPVSRISVPRTVPPKPQLQTDPAADMAEVRKKESTLLNSYGWVDRKNGIVRIPIERAMELIGRRGVSEAGKHPTKSPLQMRQGIPNTEGNTP